MGGLIARAALTGVARGLADWPPYLDVEDVATLGTPHAGTTWAYLCFYRQRRSARRRIDALSPSM